MSANDAVVMLNYTKYGLFWNSVHAAAYGIVSCARDLQFRTS